MALGRSWFGLLLSRRFLERETIVEATSLIGWSMSPEPQAVSVEEEELPNGTSLFHGQFKIESFLSSGGFGVTYLARDSLDRRVVIKECFPAATCRREGLQVLPQHRVPEDDFRAIVELFVDEARNLAKLEHPNIMGVHQVFEDNGTAYMALDYIRGRELLDLIDELDGPPAPEDVMTLLRVMLETVEYIHDRGILHRDISPDNILIQEDGAPVLIDFGAARADAMFRDRRTAILAVKDGYSPQEFYVGGSQHVPSSDLYSLAATIYHLVAGEAPVSSNDRLAAVASQAPDPIVPLAERATGYDARFVESIDKALQVFQRDRFAAASDWRSFVFPSSDTVTQIYDANGQPASQDSPKGKPRLKVVTAGDLTTTDDSGKPDVRAAVQAAIANQVGDAALTDDYIDEAEDHVPAAQVSEPQNQASFDKAMADTAPKGKKGPWLALGAVAVLGGTVAAAALLINPSSTTTPDVTGEAPVVAEVSPAATPAPAAPEPEAVVPETATAAPEAISTPNTTAQAPEAQPVVDETVTQPEDVAVAAPAPATPPETTEATDLAPTMGQPLRIEDLPEWVELANPAPAADPAANSVAPRSPSVVAPSPAPVPDVSTNEAQIAATVQPAPSAALPADVVEPGLPDQFVAADTAPASPDLANPADTSDLLASLTPEATAPAEVRTFSLPQIVDPGLETAPRPLQVQAPAVGAPAGLEETFIETAQPVVVSTTAILNAIDAEPFATALPTAADAPVPTSEGVILAAIGPQETGPIADTTAPEPVAAPEPAPAASVFAENWVLDLPFSTNSADETTIFAVRIDAPEWMQTGQRIVSVNGVPVASVEDIRKMVLLSGEPSADGVYTADFGVMDEGATSGRVIETEFAAKRQLTLPNEVSFETVRVADAWQTVVAASPFSGDTALLAGDVLVGFIPTNEKFEASDSFETLMAREVADGRTNFDFAVQRDGALWVVSMPLTQ